MTTKSKRISVRFIIAACLVAVVVAVVAISVILLDSPAEARLQRLDERRIADLHEISYAVDVYWTREGMVPPSLEVLGNEERIVRELADPETGERYEYRVLGGNDYELCAVFAREIDAGGRDVPYEYLWYHGPGRQCFQLTAQDINRNSR